MSSSRSWWLLIAGFAVLLAVVAGEIALRVFPGLMSVQWQLRNAEAKGGQAFVVNPDKELGYLYPVTDESDRYGFQNDEPWPKDVSVVFLGDSLLSGAGVGIEKSFPRLIARALPDDPVLNLGLAAAGIERQYLIYRRFAGELRPRVVVAGLYLAADFENDAAFLEWQRASDQIDFLRFRGIFSAQQRGGYEPYVDWKTALRTLQFRRLLEKSRLYERAGEIAGKIGNPYPDSYLFADGTRMMLDEFTVRFAATPALQNDPRIDTLLATTNKLREFVEQRGAELLVMFIPSREELFGVPEAVANSNVVARTQERLLRAGFSVLGLYSAIRKGASMTTPFFPNDIHLNEYGNRLVADEFLAWFNAHRWKQ